MCVIVVQKNKFPGWDVLKNCWEHNPDGAGYMYRKNDSIVISKGYNNFEDFKRSVESIKDYKNVPIVYHFRIATHGTVVPENTHPFPLTNKVKNLKALDLTCPCGIAHNGIINGNMYDNQERLRYNLSDTGQFIREITNMATKDGYISKNSILTQLRVENKLSGSRFVMFDKKDLYMIGKFYEIDGCWYSNNHSHTPIVRYYNRYYGGRVYEG